MRYDGYALDVKNRCAHRALSGNLTQNFGPLAGVFVNVPTQFVDFHRGLVGEYVGVPRFSNLPNNLLRGWSAALLGKGKSQSGANAGEKHAGSVTNGGAPF